MKPNIVVIMNVNFKRTRIKEDGFGSSNSSRILIMENSDLTEKLKRISAVDESASVQDEFKQYEFGSLWHFSSSLFSLIICDISEEQR